MLTAGLAVAALLLAGCGGPGEQESAPDAVETVTPVPAPAAPQVENAVADLAERQEVAESDVRVESVTEVTWPDGSLGCPQPGEMYTQALVEGLEIVLSVGATRYAYHSSVEGEPFLCEQPAERPREGQPSSDG